MTTATINTALAAFTDAEMIETLVTCALVGHTTGTFGEAEKIGDVWHVKTARGIEAQAWGTADGWAVKVGCVEAHATYLLNAAHAALEE